MSREVFRSKSEDFSFAIKKEKKKCAMWREGGYDECASSIACDECSMRLRHKNKVEYRLHCV